MSSRDAEHKSTSGASEKPASTLDRVAFLDQLLCRRMGEIEAAESRLAKRLEQVKEAEGRLVKLQSALGRSVSAAGTTDNQTARLPEQAQAADPNVPRLR